MVQPHITSGVSQGCCSTHRLHNVVGIVCVHDGAELCRLLGLAAHCQGGLYYKGALGFALDDHLSSSVLDNLYSVSPDGTRQL